MCPFFLLVSEYPPSFSAAACPTGALRTMAKYTFQAGVIFQCLYQFFFTITSSDMRNATIPKRFEQVSLLLFVVEARRETESIVSDSLLFAYTRALDDG